MTRQTFIRLIQYVEALLNPRGQGESFTWDCAHDFRCTHQFCQEDGLDPATVTTLLARAGAGCDCEILFNVLTSPWAQALT